MYLEIFNSPLIPDTKGNFVFLPHNRFLLTTRDTNYSISWFFILFISYKLNCHPKYLQYLFGARCERNIRLSKRSVAGRRIRPMKLRYYKINEGKNKKGLKEKKEWNCEMNGRVTRTAQDQMGGPAAHLWETEFQGISYLVDSCTSNFTFD